MADHTLLERTLELHVNSDWATLPLFDRSKWQRVRFDDVVENLNETECDPAGAGIARFIAMEHLEPGSLHILEWGNVADGVTFNRRCRPGQVLFGKRRAYQRKVAVAEFDAVVSGDIYVFAPKDDRLLPELLLFLSISERFFNFAVETSAGSLSPRTNWSSLASFEFDLPPLTQQHRIAELLMALDENKELMLKVMAATRDLYVAETEAKLDELFHGRCERLDNLLTGSPEGGNSAPPSATETGHYVLSLAALSRNGYLKGNLKPILPTKAMLECRVRSGDLLISRSNTQELVGLAGIFDEDRDDVSFPDTMMRLRVDDSRIDKHFLEAVLRSRRGRRHMMRSAAGTSGSMKKINRNTLGSCRIPTPSLHVQGQLLAQMQCIEHSIGLARAACKANHAFTRHLLENIFNKPALSDE